MIPSTQLRGHWPDLTDLGLIETAAWGDGCVAWFAQFSEGQSDQTGGEAMIQIQAVDVDKVTRFWQGVPHQMPVSIVKGDTPSMRLVITALSGSLNQEVDSLIAKGAELVERTDYEALMKDPEGNEFVVEIDPDLTGL